MEDYVPEPAMGHPSDRYENGGFVRERGKEHIGFKVIEEGIVFEGVSPAKNLSAGL